jgi:hypothetical protein
VHCDLHSVATTHLSLVSVTEFVTSELSAGPLLMKHLAWVSLTKVAFVCAR